MGFLLGFALVLVSVGVHYEGLRVCSGMIRQFSLHRLGVAFAIVGALVAHMIEILVFAVGMRLMISLGIGTLAPRPEGFADVLYFSAVTYSSLGYGDVVPTGIMRPVAGLEALTGLVMIAWTASFSFLQMQHFWDDRG